jgi:hypothetical protein
MTPACCQWRPPRRVCPYAYTSTNERIVSVAPRALASCYVRGMQRHGRSLPNFISICCLYTDSTVLICSLDTDLIHSEAVNRLFAVVYTCICAKRIPCALLPTRKRTRRGKARLVRVLCNIVTYMTCMHARRGDLVVGDGDGSTPLSSTPLSFRLSLLPSLCLSCVSSDVAEVLLSRTQRTRSPRRSRRNPRRAERNPRRAGRSPRRSSRRQPLLL